MRDVDVAVAAGDAAVAVVALFPQADHLGAELRLEHARQHQHRRHRRQQDLVLAAVGAHGGGQSVHRLGGRRQGAAVEGRGDALVGIEHDHAHAQAAARPQADAALGEQGGQELPVGIAEQQGRLGAAAEIGPGCGGGRDGVTGNHDRHDRRCLAGGHQVVELRGIEIAEIVDGEEGHGIAGERPDELAQLAVEPGQREIGNAITGAKAERVGHRGPA